MMQGEHEGPRPLEVVRGERFKEVRKWSRGSRYSKGRARRERPNAIQVGDVLSVVMIQMIRACRTVKALIRHCGDDGGEKRKRKRSRRTFRNV